MTDLNYKIMTENYIHILESRAIAICHYLNTAKAYAPWKDNWKLLKKNLDKTKVTFTLLKSSDQDVAYVIDKGDSVNFKLANFEDNVLPINVYQYVLYHEMAHMSTHLIQHPPGFWKLLSLICAAAYELKFFNLKTIDKINTRMGDIQVITYQDLYESVLEGFDQIVEKNPDLTEYYETFRRVLM